MEYTSHFVNVKSSTRGYTVRKVARGNPNRVRGKRREVVGQREVNQHIVILFDKNARNAPSRGQSAPNNSAKERMRKNDASEQPRARAKCGANGYIPLNSDVIDVFARRRHRMAHTNRARMPAPSPQWQHGSTSLFSTDPLTCITALVMSKNGF